MHEIKVSRADLLGDAKRPGKRAACLAVSQQLYDVLGRAAPERRLDSLGFEVGMALARADRSGLKTNRRR